VPGVVGFPYRLAWEERAGTAGLSDSINGEGVRATCASFVSTVPGEGRAARKGWALQPAARWRAGSGGHGPDEALHPVLAFS